MLFALHGAVAGSTFFVVMHLTRHDPGWTRWVSVLALLGAVVTILIFTVEPMSISWR